MNDLEALDRGILDPLWLKVVLICFICTILGILCALLTMPTGTYDYTPLVKSVVKEI